MGRWGDAGDRQNPPPASMLHVKRLGVRSAWVESAIGVSQLWGAV
ncbi:hypothetical protein QUB63_17685 [Microcoleus sp. ARI1-B5]